MLIQLKNILGRQELARVNALLAGAEFADGRLSAGLAAGAVKHNREVTASEARVEQINQIVMGNLLRHKTYQRAALPLKIASPFYACYEAGMKYGQHIDDPIMGQPGHSHERYRSDMAITVFLSEPHQYQGGELLIDTDYGRQAIKYPAGDGVLYSAATRHQVAEVTDGKRLVAVTWLQSLIKDSQQRALLYQLSCAREKLLRKQPHEEHTQQVDLVYVNLVRQWSEL